MTIQEYFEQLAAENKEFMEARNWFNRYGSLNLTISEEVPTRLTVRNLSIKEHRKMRFEMCGPRISKELAMRMSADYNHRGISETFGQICCYNNTVYQPNNYSVFHLNGNVGLNGITWDEISLYKILDTIMDLIKNYPTFEFAIFFVYSNKAWTIQEEKEFTIPIVNVNYGFRYDPQKSDWMF